MALALATTAHATAHVQQRRKAVGAHAARQPSVRQPWAAAAAARRCLRRLQAADPSSSAAATPEDEGLLPEEDAEIPGSYRDAMSSKTPLGKAVAGACDELDALGSLERQALEEAEGLLKKLGFKGSLFAAPQQPQQQAGQQQQQQQQQQQAPPEGQ